MSKLPKLRPPAPSESGEKLLTLLRSIPGGAICQPCTAKRLNCNLQDVLKATKELTLQGLALADYAACSGCHMRTLVARLRAVAFSR